MTGIVGNKWSFDNFAPMEAYPDCGQPDYLCWRSEDSCARPLEDLVEKIAAGTLERIWEVLRPFPLWSAVRSA